MANNLDALKEIFHVTVKPIADSTNPVELTNGGAGFDFNKKVWVLKHPTSGEIIRPNEFEAKLSVIADRIDDNYDFYADGVGKFKYYDDLADINPAYTTNNITLANLYTNMRELSILIVPVNVGSSMNNTLPNTLGGYVEYMKVGGVLVGEFTSADGKKKALYYNNTGGTWKEASASDSIERSAVTPYIKQVTDVNSKGNLGMIAKGVLLRGNLLANPDFANSGAGWTVTNGAVTAVNLSQVQITPTGANVDVVVSQETSLKWLAKYLVEGHVGVYSTHPCTVFAKFNNSISINAEDTVGIQKQLKLTTAGSTIADGAKLKLYITFRFNSLADAAAAQCYISLLEKPTLNMMYGSPYIANNMKEYNRSNLPVATKVNIKSVGANKFNKNGDIVIGYKLVNGVITADPLYFIGTAIADKGFRVVGASNFAWKGFNVETASHFLQNGTVKESSDSFDERAFMFSALLSEIDNIAIYTYDDRRTEYIKYQESNILLDTELRGFSNGTASYLYDEIRNINDDGTMIDLIHIKRISEGKLVDPNVISLSNGIGNQYVTIPLTQFPGLTPQTTNVKNNSIFIDGIVDEVANNISNGAIYSYQTTTTNLMISFPTGTFVNLEDAMIKIGQYIFYYQIDVEMTKFELRHTLIANGASIYSNTPSPILKLNRPTNSGATLTDTFDKLSEISKAMENIGEIIPGGGTSGVLGDSGTVILSAASFTVEIPDLDYDPVKDMLVVFMSTTTYLARNLDYIVEELNGKYLIKKMDPVLELPSSVKWPISTRFDFLVFKQTSTDKQYIIPKRYTSSFTTEVATTLIPVQLPMYNRSDDDVLWVDENNYVAHESINFTVRYGSIDHNGTEYIGYYIELIGYVAPVGTLYYFELLKAVRSTDIPGLVDPTRIKKGITAEQFNDETANALLEATNNALLVEQMKTLLNKCYTRESVSIFMTSGAFSNSPSFYNFEALYTVPGCTTSTVLSVEVEVGEADAFEAMGLSHIITPLNGQCKFYCNTAPARSFPMKLVMMNKITIV